MASPWYHIANIEQLDSPALVVFPPIVKNNIQTLVGAIDDVSRLRPHIKTHKSKEVIALLQNAGIQKFKCATIAETELLASCHVEDILLAYQPVGVKLLRFIQIIKQFPNTHFSCLIDSLDLVEWMAKTAYENQIQLSLCIDLNLGMNRTGIVPEKAFDLWLEIQKYTSLFVEGLHIYDGNIRDLDLQIRAKSCNLAFERVGQLSQNIENQGFNSLKIIVGGTPTFPIHAQRKNVECSPGTFVYWDKGYQDAFPEQDFQPAALVICRVISLPESHKICLDLGYKAIASENDLYRRVYFLNAPEATFISHNEEHLVLEFPTNHSYKIGDIFYGLPYHICPTCALYKRAYVVENERLTGEEWKIVARDNRVLIH